MECPHCQKEIPGKPCAHCGTVVPSNSRFCLECGESFENEPFEGVDQTDDELDLDSRVLCPDGTCTGIMVDGKCSECGRTEAEIEEQEA